MPSQQDILDPAVLSRLLALPLHARQPMYSQIPPVLRTYLTTHPNAVILMDTSVYPEIVSLTGIPLRQTINESDLQFYRDALAAPAAYAALVLAFDGDEIDQAANYFDPGVRFHGAVSQSPEAGGP